MRRLSFHLCAICMLTLFSCNKHDFTSSFVYPQSKIWFHGANDTALAQQKSLLFDGLELDVNFSEFQNELFIGHELYDTINRITLRQWFEALDSPQRNHYWVDLKNLTPASAPDIAIMIRSIADDFGITGQLMVEHTDENALNILKSNGLHVILWVENTYWTHTPDKEWKRSTQRQIDLLHPDALSCEYRMYPLLNQSFPNQNIHFWDTPKQLTDENAAFTQTLCREPNVRVVLVDYPEPIEY